VLECISACEVPEGTLLHAYQRGGSYADCFMTQAGGVISHAEYVEAFYTTTLFKVERLVLAWLVWAPSTDDEARELAAGQRDSFAAWRVEERNKDQILMSVGRTRSWLMVNSGQDTTRLYFGSAVVPKSSRGGGGPGFGFAALLGFHKLYSRALLAAARAKLGRSHRSNTHRRAS
jgi:hypothetical protein